MHKTHGEWTNVPGNLTIEVVKEDGYWDIGKGDEIPQPLADAIAALFPDKTEFQVEINFLSSGSWEDAHISRYPENDHPASRDDERLLDNIIVSPAEEDSMTGYNEKAGKKIPQPAADTIFALYMEDVEEVEIQARDEPDYDDRDD
jgi:hypothetical protein